MNRQKLTVLIIVSILVTPFVFYSSARKPWGSLTMSIWQEVVYPFEYTWHEVSSSLRRVWRSYATLREAQEENQVLRKKIAEIQAKTMDYDYQIGEVARLRGLLGFFERRRFPMSVAEVIGTPTDTPFGALRITRGHTDGVEPGMPVVTADGIVGKVIRAGLKYSDVLLVDDNNFHLDILIERTRVRGVLQGQGNNRCRVRLHRRANIKIGDQLITSGIVGGFPKGLRVGRVIKVSYESDDISQIIVVEPWVDHRRQEEVLVIHRADEDIRKIAETVGKEWMENAATRVSSQ